MHPEKTSVSEGNRDITQRVGQLLATVGGFASLLAGIGYIYYYAFFRTIGATWLVGELTLGEIAFGSVYVVALLIWYAILARFLRRLQLLPEFLSAKDRPVVRRSPALLRVRTGMVLVVAGIITHILLLKPTYKNLPQLLSLKPGALLPLGLIMVVLGSSILALDAFAATQEAPGGKRGVAASLAFWFAIAGLALAPALAGIVNGQRRLAVSEKDLTCVVLNNQNPTVCLPVLYIGRDRIYCLPAPTPNCHREVIPVEWKSVAIIRLPKAD
ncbi:MAG: hypothetical protein QOC81_3333 [Thermoanaerobaculia bacterium]|jgi:hypothetical protein|nr:hypothetical protein [Thermoanaerobaculia bacterium]